MYNKCDLLARGERAAIGKMAGETNVFISAATGEGIESLLSAVEEKLSELRRRTCFHVPHGREDEWSFLYRRATVEKVEYLEDCVEIVAVADAESRGKLRQYITKESV